MREEILTKQPEARLKVYAIWFNMIWTDSRSRWPEEVLADPRVEHFWDAEKTVGRWYVWYEEHVTHRGEEVEWDAFFLYAPGVSWGEAPPPAVTWGRPILRAKDRLRDGLRTFLGEKKTREEPDG